MKSGVAVFGQGLHCNVVTASFTYLYDALDASFNSLFFFFLQAFVPYAFLVGCLPHAADPCQPLVHKSLNGCEFQKYSE